MLLAHEERCCPCCSSRSKRAILASSPPGTRQIYPHSECQFRNSVVDVLAGPSLSSGIRQTRKILSQAPIAEFEALDLAGRGLWQFIDKRIPARAFERGEQFLRVSLESRGEIFTGADTGFHHYKRLGSYQTTLIRR